MESSKLSIIIPTCNEKSNGYLSQIWRQYPQDMGIEFIVVDSGTDARLFKDFQREDFRIFPLPASNRAQRLSYGLQKATASLILLHHPRSLLTVEGLTFLLEHKETLKWGGFTHAFDKDSPALRRTSWYSNTIRPKTSKIIYLDHCIFFQKELLNKPIPPIPIFEDTEISKILGAQAPPEILPFVSKTSAVRFETNGFWKQALMNQMMKLGYHLRWSRGSMNTTYEKNLKLNE